MLTFTNKTKYVSSKLSNSITYCKVRVSAEVSPSAQPPATINLARLSKSAGVIIPAGTQQGWARWKSIARDAIEQWRLKDVEPAFLRRKL